MKNIIQTLSLVLFFFTAVSGVQAQDEQPKKSGEETTEFKVEGVCKMCKARIERAALIKGVKFAEWDKETSMLKVVYKPKKVKVEDIHNAIAKAGHRTDKVKADPEAYAKLPACCAYDDGVEKH